MEKIKTCKVCKKTNEEVDFYKNNASTCKKCKNKMDAKRRAEKAGRVYTPLKSSLENIPEGYKMCTKCEKILLLENFYVLGALKKDGSNKIYSRCKECEREIVLNHPKRKEYVASSNAKRKERLQEDPEYRNYVNAINKKHYETETGIITHMLYAAKIRADKNNLEFDLKREDIVLPTHCPILGAEMQKGTKEDYNMTYSLDRIDNSKGYVKGNVEVISMLANTMKNSASKEQLEIFAENILKYIHKDESE